VRVEWVDVAGGVFGEDRAPQGSLMGEGRGTGWRDCSLEMDTRIDDTRGGPAAKTDDKG
jgi:hypothetical protein